MLGDERALVSLPSGGSYASFILLPILTLATSQRLLITGAPGRGKTSVALLIGLLAGHSSEEMRRAIQRGHPQLTIGDLLGSPLPSQLMRAEAGEPIHVEWKRWITMRVKIIDEYNRIPTKTQSALLSLMAEGYAEMYEQTVSTGRTAWFLTANDDLGGGTFPVIEALKDRIDAVVRTTPYSARHLEALLERVTEAKSPEDYIPRDLLFSPEELDDLDAEVRGVEVPADVLELLGFFACQLDFCSRASDRLESKNKDVLHLANRRVAHVCTEECPLDKLTNLCSQSENGVSARAYQSILRYAKALAYFRGELAVSAEDLRQILPFVLQERLQPNPHSPFFQHPENERCLIDRVAWIRDLFDRAVLQLGAYSPLRDRVKALQAEHRNGLDGLAASGLKQRLNKVRQTIELLLNSGELSAPVHEDLILLKSIHATYQDRLAALTRRA